MKYLEDLLDLFTDILDYAVCTCHDNPKPVYFFYGVMACLIFKYLI